MTFAYLKKNFLLPTVAMLVPAVVACFLYTPYWEVSFVAHFDFEPYRSASETFWIMFGDSWQYVWPVIVVAVLQAIGAAMIVSAVDRHFRTGDLSLKTPVRLINNSIFPIGVGVVIMSLTAIVLRMLLFGLVSLVQVILVAMSAAPGVGLAVISAMAIIVFFLHTLVLIPMLMWAPITFIYGYKFRDAAALSFKLISGKKLFWGMFLPMLICAGLQLLMGFLQVHAAIACAVSFVVFLFTNVYTTVFTMIAFYDISGLDRRDIAPYKRHLQYMQMQVESEQEAAPAKKSAEPKKQTEPKKPSESKRSAPKKSATHKKPADKKPKKSNAKPNKTEIKPGGEDSNVL